MLQMENTGLKKLDAYFLQVTGMWKQIISLSIVLMETCLGVCARAGLYRLEISYSQLSDVPDEAFSGLERSLWELLLHHNELIEIPSHALLHLRKLRHLDLSSNYINCIEQDSFRGLADSLQILNLGYNSINSLPPDAFGGLPNLETIDLSGNNLAHIEPNAFRDGMPRLAKVLMIFKNRHSFRFGLSINNFHYHFLVEFS